MSKNSLKIQFLKNLPHKLIRKYYSLTHYSQSNMGLRYYNLKCKSSKKSKKWELPEKKLQWAWLSRKRCELYVWVWKLSEYWVWAEWRRLWVCFEGELVSELVVSRGELRGKGVELKVRETWVSHIECSINSCFLWALEARFYNLFLLLGGIFMSYYKVFGTCIIYC